MQSFLGEGGNVERRNRSLVEERGHVVVRFVEPLEERLKVSGPCRRQDTRRWQPQREHS
ncbi:hypothetical protein THF1C08_550021 [Vibrio jasicida]|uniref:Uncharacterized protein n=1 Tax=Vibrio jasicida TaxID=766224 RepID=A0AAU9QUK1_9VIBR|nr:hypothetical protein THF1C08_550021 [Vibrio jasicida]CAH1602284.1 hypothetical protein THF1A12_560021 [Vibrio jasicida]